MSSCVPPDACSAPHRDAFADVLALSHLRLPEMKPALLRVLTDLFVTRRNHPAETIAQYEALAFPLALAVDAGEAATIAARLAPHPDAPPAILLALAGRGGQARLAILARRYALDPESALEIAHGGEADAARAISMRDDLDDDVLVALARRDDREVALALAERPIGRLPGSAARTMAERARNDRTLAVALLTREDTPFDVKLGLFLLADASLRAKLVREASLRAFLDRRRPVFASDPLIDAAIDAAIPATPDSRPRLALWSRIAARLHLDSAGAEAILDDPDGEPLALALRALGAEPSRIVALFLRSGRPIALDFGRMRAIDALARRVTPACAGSILAAIAPDAARRAAEAAADDKTSHRAGVIDLARTAVMRPRERASAQPVASSRKLRP